MARTKCPVREVIAPDGDPVPGTKQWRCYDFGLPKAWRDWAAGAFTGERLVPPPARRGAAEPRAESGAPLQLRWAPHWIISAGNRELCVRCGTGPLKTAARNLRGWPCPGYRDIRAAAAVAIRSGRFDAALRDAPALWRAKVAREFPHLTG